VYDYYDLLGVDRDAEPETIEVAFRERIRELHPDRDDSAESTEEVVRLQRAREVLTDSALRKDYDRLGHREFVERERQSGSGDVDLRSADEDPTTTRSRSRTPRLGESEGTQDDPGTARRSRTGKDQPGTDDQPSRTPDGRAESGEPTPNRTSTDSVEFGRSSDSETNSEFGQESPTDDRTDAGRDRHHDTQGTPESDEDLDAVVDLDELLDETNVGTVDPDEVLSDSRSRDPDDFADENADETVPDVNVDWSPPDDHTSDDPDDSQSHRTDTPIGFGESTTDRNDAGHQNASQPASDGTTKQPFENESPPDASTDGQRSDAPTSGTQDSDQGSIDDGFEERSTDTSFDDTDRNGTGQPENSFGDTSNSSDRSNGSDLPNDTGSELEPQSGDPLAGPGSGVSDPSGEPQDPMGGTASGIGGAPDESPDSTAGDPQAGTGGEPVADSGADPGYAGTDGGVETPASGAVAGQPTGATDDSGGIIAAMLSVPAAIVALPYVLLARLLAVPSAVIAAIPTFGIPGAIGETRLLLGSDWYSEEVAVMARYAWLGRLLLAGVAWPLFAVGLPGATLVPSASSGTLAAIVIVLGLAHLGYDLLLSIGAELEPGCHGGAAIDPPLRGLCLLVVTYAAGVGLAAGAIWRTEALSDAVRGDTPIESLPATVLDVPEPTLAAVLGIVLVVGSLLGLLSAALTLPWSDRYDRHYHVLPGLWQAPLSIAVTALLWSIATGGSITVMGSALGVTELAIVAGGMPIVAALYLVRRRIETPNPQPAW
jgi:curved DNA-binding protein CbpA